jgi:molybdopterin biosynthesis enzyme
MKFLKEENKILNKKELDVLSKLKNELLKNFPGAELIDKDIELSFGKVRDSNSYSLVSQFKEANAEIIL